MRRPGYYWVQVEVNKPTRKGKVDKYVCEPTILRWDGEDWHYYSMHGSAAELTFHALSKEPIEEPAPLFKPTYA